MGDAVDAAEAGVTAGGAVEGDVFDERLVGDDDAGGVARGVAGDAFEAAGGVEKLFDHLFVFIFFEQFGGVEFMVVVEDVVDFDRFTGDSRDHAGEGVDIGEGDIEGAADVADGGAGAHGTEGDDLGDFFVAVAAHGVFDHEVADVIGVVEVDIGHGDAAGVEEAFEDEAVGDGVDAGDAEGVGDDGAGAGAADVPPDVVSFPFIVAVIGVGVAVFFPPFVGTGGEFAQVPDDEEVGFEAHAADDAEFMFEAGAELFVVGGAVGAVAVDEAFFAEVAEVGGRGVPVGDFKDREVISFGVEVDITHFGDKEAVFEGTGDVAKEGGHFGVRFEIIFLVGEAEAFGVVDRGAGLDAEQDIVGSGIIGTGIVDIIGGEEAEVIAGGHVDERFVDFGEFRDAMFLEFDEEAVWAEDVEIFAHEGVGGVHIAVHDGLGDFGGETAGGGDYSFAVAIEEVVVDAGFVVVAIELGRGGDLEEVEVAGLVLGEEEHVEAVFVVVGVAVGHAAGGDVGFETDNRFDAPVFAGTVEGHGAVHGTMISEGDGGLVELFGVFDEFVDTAKAIEEGEFTMNV